jgi:replicative DNA helicase
MSRKLIKAGNEIVEEGYNEGSLDVAQDLINDLSNNDTTKSKPREITEFLGETLETIQNAFENGGMITGLSTGLLGLDEKTQGLQKSDLIILAARPSMGKTSLALNIAEYTAMKGETALVFSMEMDGESITQREIASLSRIPLNLVRSGQIKDHQWPKLTDAVSRLNGLPLIIDETPALTVGELRLRAKQVKREKGLGLIVVDYIQLMTGTGNNRNEVVSEISRGLKAVAKELKVPIIALSQLNRSLESRPNKRPIMSDLRDSGAIEQDADVIIFIYRDEVYNEESPHKGLAEINIAKQRQGAIGKVHTSFIGHLCRFENYAGEIPQFSSPTRKPSFKG